MKKPASVVGHNYLVTGSILSGTAVPGLTHVAKPLGEPVEDPDTAFSTSMQLFPTSLR